jgi:replicative superfamily II helicase
MVLEIIVSRMRRISSHIGSNIRVVALSASLGNAKDLGERHQTRSMSVWFVLRNMERGREWRTIKAMDLEKVVFNLLPLGMDYCFARLHIILRIHILFT